MTPRRVFGVLLLILLGIMYWKFRAVFIVLVYFWGGILALTGVAIVILKLGLYDKR